MARSDIPIISAVLTIQKPSSIVISFLSTASVSFGPPFLFDGESLIIFNNSVSDNISGFKGSAGKYKEAHPERKRNKIKMGMDFFI
ncbi:MAG: hypothetical protein KKC46_09550 [Proteobacteria bacterium]|nr:hypothetical protein [Pseudomonadota bacterium]